MNKYKVNKLIEILKPFAKTVESPKELSLDVNNLWRCLIEQICVRASSAIIAAFFFAKDFWQILFLMALYGFGSSSVYVMSSTMAADVLPEESRATLFGAFDALMDLGLVAGPSICFAFLAISGWSINFSFLLMAIPSIVALGLIFQIRETKV